MNHTPGPWDVELHPDDEFRATVHKNGGPIAFVEATTGYASADIANARLIAAAPEILTSLKWIVTFAQEHAEWFGAEDGAEGEWLETAQAAIAKAT